MTSTSTKTGWRPGAPAHTTLPYRQLHALADTGFAAGSASDDLAPDLTDTDAWRELAESWERLPQDTYMADGGTYRQRRYAELICDSTTGDIHVGVHRAFCQPRDINPLNGGVDRLFAPIEASTVTNPVFRRIVRWYVRSFAALDGPGRWLAQCFQNRTLARPDDPGMPTPEGVHRDGMDFNVVFLVARHTVAGGVSRLYDGGTRTPLGEHLLAEPGDHLAMDDRRLLHDTTPVVLAAPISPTPSAGVGHRDAFVASFRKLP